MDPAEGILDTDCVWLRVPQALQTLFPLSPFQKEKETRGDSGRGMPLARLIK